MISILYYIRVSEIQLARNQSKRWLKLSIKKAHKLFRTVHMLLKIHIYIRGDNNGIYSLLNTRKKYIKYVFEKLFQPSLRILQSDLSGAVSQVWTNKSIRWLLILSTSVSLIFILTRHRVRHGRLEKNASKVLLRYICSSKQINQFAAYRYSYLKIKY